LKKKMQQCSGGKIGQVLLGCADDAGKLGRTLVAKTCGEAHGTMGQGMTWKGLGSIKWTAISDTAGMSSICVIAIHGS
jgi:hypothetical protein